MGPLSTELDESTAALLQQQSTYDQLSDAALKATRGKLDKVGTEKGGMEPHPHPMGSLAHALW